MWRPYKLALLFVDPPPKAKCEERDALEFIFSQPASYYAEFLHHHVESSSVASGRMTQEAILYHQSQMSAV